MDGSLWEFSLFLFLAAAACTGAAAWLNDRIRREELFHARAEGKVVEIRSVPSALVDPTSEYHDLYYAVIEFFADGKLIRVQSKEQEFPCGYQVGQKLMVLYETADPSHFEIRANGPRDLAAFALKLASMVLLIAGVIAFLAAAR